MQKTIFVTTITNLIHQSMPRWIAKMFDWQFMNQVDHQVHKNIVINLDS